MPLAVELASDVLPPPPLRRWLIAGLDEVRIVLETLFIYIYTFILIKKIMIIEMGKTRTFRDSSRIEYVMDGDYDLAFGE